MSYNNSQRYKPRTEGGSSDNIYSVEESSGSDELSESSDFNTTDTHSGSGGDNKSVEPELGPSLCYR